MNKSIEDMSPQEVKKALEKVYSEILKVYRDYTPGATECATRFMCGANVPGSLFMNSEGEEDLKNRATLLHFSIAFQNPEKFEGIAYLSLNDKTVFEIEEGKVIKDDLNLCSHFQLKERMEELGEVMDNYTQGLEVARNVSKFTDIYTQGEGEQESENYKFSLKNGVFKVTATEGNRTVLTDSGFTPQASEEDREFLTKLSEVAKQLQKPDQDQDQNYNQEYDLKPKM